MILIVGGAFQGKGRIARAMADSGDAEGGERPVILSFHEQVRRYLEEHPEAAEIQIRAFAARAAETCPEAVVTMDEVGCGVVPVDKEERQYPEAVGAAGQELAARAEKVYRVTAGIPVRIK